MKPENVKSKNMDLLSKMFSKMAAYQKCIDTKCKLEANAHKKASEGHKQQISSVRADFLAGKLSFDKMQSEIKKISSAIATLEESKKKNECAFKKCKGELVDYLGFLAEVTKEDCKKNKLPKACDMSKEFQRYKKLVQDDKITHEHMTELTLKFMKA